MPIGSVEALLAYADLARGDGDRLIHRARDAYMARQILERMGPDLAPHEVAAVLGAAHAAAFAARDVEPALEARLPAPVPCAIAIGTKPIAGTIPVISTARNFSIMPSRI